MVLIVYVISILSILYMDYAHAKEREKLLDRIQARDLAEVKTYQQPKPKPEKKEEIVYL